MKRHTVILFLILLCLTIQAQQVKIICSGKANNRVQYASEYLQKKLLSFGYQVAAEGASTGYRITLRLAKDTAGLHKEGYTITTQGKKITVVGNDGSGVIYGCSEIADYVRQHHSLQLPARLAEAPEMVLRGSCVGLQKTTYLPGHSVYEYPYTPQNFPWFYDRQQWIKYLDMLVDNKMNSLYLWNGHPFASLVKLKDYPFAVEVDDDTFRKNQEMFSFLTHEADRRGIFVIQMFYNIIVSKPFADHYGIKTQDRNRPITPLLSDYTRKSIAAFIAQYPNVGLLVCLGEAMNTYDDDVEWMTQTIIPGVKDGLKALGRTDEPPILLRAHDTDCKRVMEASLPLYHNLYTMHKYTGESLTTYQPQGPWAQMHRDLAALGTTHIENVHILANLEPWRWSSPDFVQKTVQAMKQVHHANALHLYPQASYWDWPYTADKLPDGKREYQLDRDWMWYQTWGRYAWNCHRSRQDEIIYWDDILATQFGVTPAAAANIRTAYEESGEIAPKLLRRFGITEGNRQTLLLGMKASQLVNPYKYTVYPGFYESCGPTGEKLIEYAAKNFQHQPHTGELPLDIVAQTEAHGDSAVAAIDRIAHLVTCHQDEFARLQNDMHCYREFAYSFGWKVKGCLHVLNYQYTHDITQLDTAALELQKGLEHYRKLVSLTKDTYLYANSMQTAQRRIPIGGDDGKMKTWAELLPVYEQELSKLRANIVLLKNQHTSHSTATITETPVIKARNHFTNQSSITPLQPSIMPLQPADVKVIGDCKWVKLSRGVRLFTDLDSTVTDIAPELSGLSALVLSSEKQRSEGNTFTFICTAPVSLLIGYFRDDQMKYAQAPKLETDASANDYQQAEPQITSALRINGMPQVNVHKYVFSAGQHTLNLPKGMLLVLGFTSSEIVPRDAALSGEDAAIDWLFY
jgi:hypothetical protein